MTSLETVTNEDIMIIEKSTQSPDEASISGATMQTTTTERELREGENAGAQSMIAISDVARDVNFDTFTCFPKLPLEIQRRIWRAAAYIPRIVPFSDTVKNITRGIPGSTYTHDVGIAGLDMQVSKTPQAAILQVCQESRKECISIYELIFGIQFRKFSVHFENLHKENKYYFNPYADTLYIANRFCKFPRFYLCSHEQLEVSPFLRSLAIDIDWFLRTCSFRSRFVSNLMRMIQVSENLEEVILVGNQYEYADPRSKTPKHGEWEFYSFTRPTDSLVNTALENVAKALDELRALRPARTEWPVIKAMGVAKGGVPL